jgi:hypothetical protein
LYNNGNVKYYTFTSTLIPPNGASSRGALGGKAGSRAFDDVAADCSPRPRFCASNEVSVTELDNDNDDEEEEDEEEVAPAKSVLNDVSPNDVLKLLVSLLVLGTVVGVDEVDGSGSIVVSRPRRFFDVDDDEEEVVVLESVVEVDGFVASAALVHAVSPGISIQLLHHYIQMYCT